MWLLSSVDKSVQLGGTDLNPAEGYIFSGLFSATAKISVPCTCVDYLFAWFSSAGQVKLWFHSKLWMGKRNQEVNSLFTELFLYIRKLAMSFGIFLVHTGFRYKMPVGDLFICVCLHHFLALCSSLLYKIQCNPGHIDHIRGLPRMFRIVSKTSRRTVWHELVPISLLSKNAEVSWKARSSVQPSETIFLFPLHARLENTELSAFKMF